MGAPKPAQRRLKACDALAQRRHIAPSAAAQCRDRRGLVRARQSQRLHCYFCAPTQTNGSRARARQYANVSPLAPRLGCVARAQAPLGADECRSLLVLGVAPRSPLSPQRARQAQRPHFVLFLFSTGSFGHMPAYARHTEQTGHLWRRDLDAWLEHRRRSDVAPTSRPRQRVRGPWRRVGRRAGGRAAVCRWGAASWPSPRCGVYFRTPSAGRRRRSAK